MKTLVLRLLLTAASSFSAPQTPPTLNDSREEAGILTPKPPHTPRINGARVFGVRPGSPVLISIPATGDRDHWKPKIAHRLVEEFEFAAGLMNREERLPSLVGLQAVTIQYNRG